MVMATVLLGTLYPLVLQVLNIAKISVGPPYFNAVFVPLSCVMFFLMPLAPVCRWKQMSLRLLFSRVYLSFLISLAMAFILPWLLVQEISVGVVIGLSLAFWIILSTLSEVYSRMPHISRTLLAMTVAHIGVAITIIGITLTSHFSIEKNAILHVGESTMLGSQKISLMLVDEEDGSNYHGVRAEFQLMPDDETIIARKHFYTVSGSVMSLPGIDMTLWRDVYIALGEETQDHQGFEIRLYKKPFVRWIWLGALLMALGGVIALGKKN